MSIVIFSAVTSGRPDPLNACYADIEAFDNARLSRLSWVVCEPDRVLTVRCFVDTMVTSDCVEDVLQNFVSSWGVGSTLVAHDLEPQISAICSEMERLDRDDLVYRVGCTQKLCTADVCRRYVGAQKGGRLTKPTLLQLCDKAGINAREAGVDVGCLRSALLQLMRRSAARIKLLLLNCGAKHTAHLPRHDRFGV